jgi:hypothetical protein
MSEVQFKIRMPEVLRERVRMHAAYSRRSMTQEFIMLIERGLAANEMRQVQPLDQPIETAASMLQNVE